MPTPPANDAFRRHTHHTGRPPMTAPPTIRTFIAVGVPAAARRDLADAAGQLRAHMPPAVRWAAPEGMHLTLKFLGNIAPALAAPLLSALTDAAQETAPFALRLAGLGVFPHSRRPRVLWAGVTGDTDALAALQQAVERASIAVGFAAESRPFAPHITLGRVCHNAEAPAQQRVGQAINAAPPLPPSSWTVDAIQLMQSVPTPGGMRYAELGAAKFGRAAPDSGQRIQGLANDAPPDEGLP